MSHAEAAIAEATLSSIRIKAHVAHSASLEQDADIGKILDELIQHIEASSTTDALYNLIHTAQSEARANFKDAIGFPPNT